ncbi:hypothetical protein B0T16DRAFT_22082 [Cercophora newfieldiana]|uniref:Secreted protein n=1 Tax=Cercophora newfieldiana TaxID=92897 RepID=A0AA40CY54_9PEZI|nr:hypothetical protein B0T16DRAFT_22082 [Cercophora newfieldiana]
MLGVFFHRMCSLAVVSILLDASPFPTWPCPCQIVGLAWSDLAWTRLGLAKFPALSAGPTLASAKRIDNQSRQPP